MMLKIHDFLLRLFAKWEKLDPFFRWFFGMDVQEKPTSQVLREVKQKTKSPSKKTSRARRK